MVTNEQKATLQIVVDITPYGYSGAYTDILSELVMFVVKRCPTAEVSASRRSLRVTAMVPAAELPTIDGFMSQLKADVQSEIERLRGNVIALGADGARRLTWQHGAPKTGDHEVFTDEAGNRYLLDGKTIALLAARYPT